MGKRDYRHRETKKPKKDTRKNTPVTFESAPPVEVIKKGKKNPENTEE